MTDPWIQRRLGFALSQPGDPKGVSCDADGPSIGPIRLLERKAAALVPRRIEELDEIFSTSFGKPVSCQDLLPGLSAVAAALNAGDMTRAIFATQFMRLPDLTEAQADRALGAAALRKASVDEEKHPGWPAGSPDGKGGKFRPKNGYDSTSNNSVEPQENRTSTNLDETRQRIARKAFRLGVAKILNARRIARLLMDETLPVFYETLAMKELAETIREFEGLSKDVNATTEFLKEAPYSIDQLKISAEDIKFSSMNAFVKSELEKRFGPAGEGYEYHHIVEQGGTNASASFSGEIHSTANIVKIPKLIHEIITGQYASSAARGRLSFRFQMRNLSFGKQYELGVKAMSELGITR